MMEAKIIRTINIDVPGVKASLLANLRVMLKKFTVQSSTITTDATTTDTSGITQLRIIENHPLVPVFGVFRDDPTWDGFIESMKEYSDMVDALERQDK